MRIAAFDISKRRTGVACGDALHPPRSWTRGFKQDKPGEVGVAFAAFAREVLVSNNAEAVVYEQALLMANRKASSDTARLLLGMAFVLETVCAARGVPVWSVPVQSWRKVFLGKGVMPDAKRATMRMCSSLGWEVAHDNDRADACGVWAWGQFEHGDRKGLMRLLSRGGVMV